MIKKTVFLISMVVISFNLIQAKVPFNNLKQSNFQISIMQGTEIPGQVDVVKGIRLSLLGKTQYVSGIDIGLIKETTEKNAGIQIGFMNTDNLSTGIRFGVINLAKQTAGLQLSLFQKTTYQNCPSIGLIYNEAVDSATGDMIGLINTAGSLIGIQFGAYNYAKDLSSLQIGLINIAGRHETGMQLGLLNFSNGGFFPFIKF